MKRGNRIKLALAAAAGLIMGVIVGNLVGVAVRSDNLLFFDALGAIVGFCAGLIMVIIIDQ